MGENSYEESGWPLGVRVSQPRDLGSVIRGLRETAGMTQIHLAERAGVSRKWISDVENGKQTIDMGMAMGVLRRLGYTFKIAAVAAADVDYEQVLAAHTGPSAR